MTRGAHDAWRALAALALGALVSSCDNRTIWHAPSIHEERMQIPKYSRAYDPNTFFPDGKAMRQPPAGTVPQGAPEPAWKEDGEYVDRIPVTLTRELMERGRRDFNVTCAACHGVRGDGDSVVAQKMTLRAPPSLLTDRIRAMKAGRLYEIVRDGYGLMAGYTTQLNEPESRWAVVAYLRALDLSQHAVVDELPPDVRRDLAKEAP